jgi:hypothetical protein
MMEKKGTKKWEHFSGKIVETYRSLLVDGSYICEVVGFKEQDIPDSEDSEGCNMCFARLKVLALTHYPIPVVYGDAQIAGRQPFASGQEILTNVRNIREYKGHIDDYPDSLIKALSYSIDHFRTLVKGEPYPDWLQTMRLNILLSISETLSILSSRR